MSEEFLDSGPQDVVAPAGNVKKSRALGRSGLFQGFKEQVSDGQG